MIKPKKQDKWLGALLMTGMMLIGVRNGVRAEMAGETETVVINEQTASESAGQAVKPIAVNKEVELKVDYYLSYPGILPDHPFYWLKMIRDRLQWWLTTKPLDKVERLLLYADKRLGAGWELVDENKMSLGVTTLTKGEKYLEEAVKASYGLPEGRQEQEFKDRLKKAVEKHKEVLELLKSRVGNEQVEVMDQMIMMAEQNRKGLTGVDEDNSVVQVEVEVDFGMEKEVIQVEARTVLEALEKATKEQGWDLKIKKYDFGSLVEEVDGKKNTQEKAWVYSVNEKSGEVAADDYRLEEEDVVKWKYIKPVF